MIEGENPILQAFLGTLITWGLTAAGSAMVYFFSLGCCSAKQKILDFSLGFAAGVMTAASFWSLMSPAIVAAEEAGYYGSRGEFAFGPCAIGFLLGGAFVLLSDKCIPRFSGKDPAIELAETTQSHQNGNVKGEVGYVNTAASPGHIELEVAESKNKRAENEAAISKYKTWKRILLLLIAITVHNIPEGLAVGVKFGGLESSTTNSTHTTECEKPDNPFNSARNLAIAIGIQNFPEGMAVSIPLRSAGYSTHKAFMYGQLSGIVEPIFGVLGALIIVVAQPLLPYALAFAAGAMIYVVVDDIIPEANSYGNGRLASWGTMIGFTIMMILDVGLAYI